ncbi:MAG: metalloregulator ArsR/SmtB family transcription factor [Arcobacteraceae bacterium]
MNEEKLVNCLAQLGNITRIRIFKLLIRAGKEGLSVGRIQEQLNIPGSTLSHHLTKLMQIDLVSQKREGRILHCTANFVLLEDLIYDLKDQCCVGIEN